MRVSPGAGNDARFKKGGLSKRFLQQLVVLNVAPGNVKELDPEPLRKAFERLIWYGHSPKKSP